MNEQVLPQESECHTFVPTQHLINLHIFPYIFRHQDLPCHASEEFADNFQAIMAMFLGDSVGSNRGNNNASTRSLCSWRNNNRSSKIYVSTSGPKAARRHQKGPIYSCKNKTITRLEICDTESFFLCSKNQGGNHNHIPTTMLSWIWSSWKGIWTDILLSTLI